MIELVLHVAFFMLGFLLGREKARTATTRRYVKQMLHISDWAEIQFKSHPHEYNQGVLDTITKFAEGAND